MKTSLLDYYKLILNKVSFDRQLLNKEYNKAITELKTGDVKQLNEWLKNEDLNVKLTDVKERDLYVKK